MIAVAAAAAVAAVAVPLVVDGLRHRPPDVLIGPTPTEAASGQPSPSEDSATPEEKPTGTGTFPGEERPSLARVEAAVRLVVVDDDPHELRIIEPTNQTGVKPGQTFVVRGEGCEPGSMVTASFLGRKTQTAAKKDGSFATSVTVPRDVKIAGHVEEAGEVSLAVACGIQRNAVVLVLDVDRQVREVPKGGVDTGGGTAGGPPLRCGRSGLLRPWAWQLRCSATGWLPSGSRGDRTPL